MSAASFLSLPLEIQEQIVRDIKPLGLLRYSIVSKEMCACLRETFAIPLLKARFAVELLADAVKAMEEETAPIFKHRITCIVIEAQYKLGDEEGALKRVNGEGDLSKKVDHLTALASAQAKTGAQEAAKATLVKAKETLVKIPTESLSSPFNDLIALAVSQAQIGDIQASLATTRDALTQLPPGHSLNSDPQFKAIAQAAARAGDKTALILLQYIEHPYHQAQVWLSVAVAQEDEREKAFLQVEQRIGTLKGQWDLGENPEWSPLTRRKQDLHALWELERKSPLFLKAQARLRNQPGISEIPPPEFFEAFLSIAYAKTLGWENKAKEVLKSAEDLLKSIGPEDYAYQVEMVLALAETHADAGEKDRAQALLDEVISILLSSKECMSSYDIEALTAIAEMQSEIENLVEAKATIGLAQSLLGERLDHLTLSSIDRSLAAIVQAEVKLQDFEAAKTKADNIHDWVLYSEAFLKIAQEEIRAGKVEEAKITLNIAEAMSRDYDIQICAVRMKIANLELELGEIPQAEQTLCKVRQLVRIVLARDPSTRARELTKMIDTLIFQTGVFRELKI